MLTHLGPATAHSTNVQADPALYVFKDTESADIQRLLPRHSAMQSDTIASSRKGAPTQYCVANGYSSSSASSPEKHSPWQQFSTRERHTALLNAELHCEDATKIVAVDVDKRAQYLEELFTKFTSEIKNLSDQDTAPSLMEHKAVIYSELDMFNAIRHVEPPIERAKLWKKMSDFYKLHESGPQSNIEQRQLTSLFFNSAYIDEPNVAGANERVRTFAKFISCDSNGQGNIRYVLSQLAQIKDPTEQLHVGERLVTRLMFMNHEHHQNALNAFRSSLHNMQSRKHARDLVTFASALYMRNASLEMTKWREDYIADLDPSEIHG